MFSEVKHQTCGGVVVFAKKLGETVLKCRRCKAVITDTNDLNPKGTVCGVVMRDVQSQRSAA